MTAPAEVGEVFASQTIGEASVLVTKALLDTVLFTMELADGAGRGITHANFNIALVAAEAAGADAELRPADVAMTALLKGADKRMCHNNRAHNAEHIQPDNSVFVPYCYEDELPALVARSLRVRIASANTENPESTFVDTIVTPLPYEKDDTAVIAEMEAEFAGSDVMAFDQMLQHLHEIGTKYANVLRVPKYASGERESDVQHSVMLTLCAVAIAEELGLDIDMDKVILYALVHDFPEIYAGDVQTFHQTDEDKRLKVANEEKAMETLRTELPDFWLEILVSYEAQEDFESGFVCAIDKLLPSAVDIYGRGIDVITNDYGVTSLGELRDAHLKHERKLQTRFSQKLGDTYEILALAHQTLNRMFEYKVATINGENNANGSNWADAELKLSGTRAVRIKQQEIAA